MKLYNIYFVKSNTLKLMRENLTEEQVDKFWSELKWWQKEAIKIVEVKKQKEQDER